MAVQPPAAPPPAPQTAATVPPPAKSKGCLGCGMGCGGCLLVIVIVAALLLGSGYFFLVAQAQAGVASPAALLVFSTPVDVGKNDSDYKPAASGQSLDAGSSVRTGDAGRATIQFPDGTLPRLSPSTTVTVPAAQLTKGREIDADKNGTLSAPRAIRPDRQDPYQLVAQCENAVSGGGNSGGTMQVSTGENLATGQTAESDYHSGGGIVSVALCYPGS